MPQSRRPTKEAERGRLKKVIAEWNASRLEIFAMSNPSEDLEFHGVMRFFFQDASHRVSTKCVRVSSTATTQQVINALVERFRPDMKMLTATAFSLFEVFPNGDECRLKPNEKPLLIQLNWHKDDLEGRFLLRRDAPDGIPAFVSSQQFQDLSAEKPTPSKLKRKLSKKEKDKERRENKGGRRSLRSRPTSTDDTAIGLSAAQGSLAEALYEELPESTLTRSISNPEAVMRRKRQQKFEKKLRTFRKDGENSGDLLRVYGESLRPEIPYKTLLVTANDTTDVIIKEAVDKFGIGKQNAKDFCLVLSSMSVSGAKRTWRPGPERIMQIDEFPLKIKQEWASMKSEPSFHLRKRPFIPRSLGTLSPHSHQQSRERERQHGQDASQEMTENDLPYLIEVTVEGHMTPDANKFRLQPNVTQIGSEQARSATGNPAVNLSQMLLPFADIQPRHCKLANMSGVVTLTPLSPQAETFVNGERITETTLLQNRSIILFGKSHTFLYVDPRQTKRPETAPPLRLHSSSAVIQSNGSVPRQRNMRTYSERSASSVIAGPTTSTRLPETASSDFGVPPSHFKRAKSNTPQVTATSEERQQERKPVEAAVGDVYSFKPEVMNTLPKASRATTVRSNSERTPSTTSGATRRNSSEIQQQSSFSGHDVGGKKLLDASNGKPFGKTTDLAADSATKNSLQPPPLVNKRKQQGSRSRLSSGSDSVFESLPGGDLPALLGFSDQHEDLLLSAVVRQCNGAAAPFKLAPAYVLYLCAKYRLSPAYQAVVMAEQGTARSGVKLMSKAVTLMSQTVQESAGCFGDLCFWLANSTEFLHFLKMDRTLADSAATVTFELESVIQTVFYQLVDCLQQELCICITSFLEIANIAVSRHEDRPSDIIVTRQQNDIPVWIQPSWQATREHGQPTVSSVISTLSTAMALLRCCRVNAALTIQLFSHAFHYINAWLFNKLVREPRLGLCCQSWGERLRQHLQRIEVWAERQGLELAAECHMAQVMQACGLLVASKSSPNDVSSIASMCFKLNSLQLRTLLHLYHPAADEAPMFPKLIAGVAGIAESTADELIRSEGQDVKLEEETHLMSPFLMPEEGYLCDIVTGMPAGLVEFLDPLVKQGLCKLTVCSASGSWAPWQSGSRVQAGIQSPVFPPSNSRIPDEGSSSPSSDHRAGDHSRHSKRSPLDDQQKHGTLTESRVSSGQPEVVEINLLKGEGGLGVSIIGGKSCGEGKWAGIYVKSIVRGGKADKDGRLQAGDQLLQVDHHSLLDVTQEEAAHIMKKTGPVVTLKIAKQAALYHGVAMADPGFTSKPQEHQGKPNGSSPQQTVAESQPVSPVTRRQRRSEELSSTADRNPRGDSRHSMGDFSPTKPQLVKWLYEQQQHRAQRNAEKERARMRNDPVAEANIEKMMREKEKEHKARMERLRKENEVRQIDRQLSDRGRTGRVALNGRAVQRGDFPASPNRPHNEPAAEPGGSQLVPVVPRHTESSSIPKVKEQSGNKENERLEKVELEWRKAFAAQSTRGAQDREREKQRLERHRSEEELRRRIVADSQYLERQKREKAFLEKLAEEESRDTRGEEINHSDGVMSVLPGEEGNRDVQTMSLLGTQAFGDTEEDRLRIDIEVSPEQRTRRPAGSDTEFIDQQNPVISIESASVSGSSSGATGESGEKTQELLAHFEQQEDNELAKQEQLLFRMQQEKAHRRELEKQAMLEQLKQEEELAIEQERRLQELRKQRELRMSQLRELEAHEEEEHRQWLNEQKRKKVELAQQRQAQESELQRLLDENSKLESLHKTRVAGSRQPLKDGSVSPEAKGMDVSRVSSPRRSQSGERQQIQHDAWMGARLPLKRKGSYAQLNEDELPETSERSRLALAQYSRSSSHSNGLSDSIPDLQLKRVHRGDGEGMDSPDRRHQPLPSPNSSDQNAEPLSPSQPARHQWNDVEWGRQSQPYRKDVYSPPSTRTVVNAAKRAEFFDARMKTSQPPARERGVESREGDGRSRSFREFPAMSETSSSTYSSSLSEQPPATYNADSRLHQYTSASPAHGNKWTVRRRTPEKRGYQPQQADV